MKEGKTMWHGKKKRTAREAGKMGDALLTIQNLSAWYNNEKRILLISLLRWTSMKWQD